MAKMGPKNPMVEPRRTDVLIPLELRKRIRMAAAKRDVSLSAIFREAIKLWLDSQPK